VTKTALQIFKLNWTISAHSATAESKIQYSGGLRDGRPAPPIRRLIVHCYCIRPYKFFVKLLCL